MRPLRLELEGFTAFRGPAVIDFADADLFALVGPTGAGKSSIIDALTFALYGSVPRLDDRRAVAPVISQNLTEARVRLDFSAGGDTYTAVRVVRATKAGATTREARLQRGHEVLAGEAREVTAAVEEVIGLGYDHFTTCVSLPQGQFAQFLHAEPGKRQDLLVRLLGLGLYDRVAGAARQRAAVARNRAEVAARQLDRLAGATPEARAAVAARIGELAALAQRLAADRSRVDDLMRRAVEEQDRAEAADAHVALLAAVAAPAGVAELAAALASAAQARERAAEVEDHAAEAVTAAEEALSRLPARVSLEALRTDLARRADLEAAVAGGEAAEADAAAELAAARDAEARARAERDDRAVTLDRRRMQHRAQALASELVPGEPCPVCGQEVHDLPASRSAPDVAWAEEALATAQRSVDRAATAVQEAATRQARADEKLTRLRAELAELAARLVATEGVARIDAAGGGPGVDAATEGVPGDAAEGVPTADETGGVLGNAAGGVPGVDAATGDATRGVPGADETEGVLGVDATGGGPGAAEIGRVPGADEIDDRLAVVAAAEADLEKARQAARDARTARREADKRHDQLVARERDARRAFDAARDAVAVLDPPAADRDDLAADWAALESWAAGRRPQVAESAERHRQAAVTARDEAASFLRELIEQCRAAGVETGPPGSWPGEAVAAARARAEADLRGIDEKLAEAERLRTEQAASTERAQVADALAGHLAANKFEKWLLDEAVHQLVVAASALLGELSGGAYALAVDARSGAFQVVDHGNASQPRPARTLSGGETFLASLALALALADHLAADLAVAGPAQLDALFLDEGFGSLDPDTLDVVAGALDDVAATRNRMVGVVTHVRELADRLPVRFEVRKAGGTATVERAEG